MTLYILVFFLGILIGILLGVWTLKSAIRNSGYEILDGDDVRRYVIRRFES